MDVIGLAIRIYEREQQEANPAKWKRAQEAERLAALNGERRPAAAPVRPH